MVEFKIYLPSLGEIKEMEAFNGGPSKDPFMIEYKKNLEAGMSDIHAHLESVLATGGGEEKMSDGFMEHIRRHRESYKKSSVFSPHS